MKSIIVILSVVFVFQSCTRHSGTDVLSNQSSKDITSGKPEEKSITGEWTWLLSEGGFAYHISNPSNTGYQFKIQFNNDGTVKYYKNDHLEYSGTYVLGTSTDPSTGLVRTTISQNYFGQYSEAELHVLSVTPNEITFNEPGADRFVHTYRRSGN